MKNVLSLVLLLGGSAILVGCASSSRASHWTNLHAGDANLAGIRVQQFPDCSGEHDRYVDRHPAMLLYVFKDGRVHQTCFEPDGKGSEDFWFTIGLEHWLWKTMDPSLCNSNPG